MEIELQDLDKKIVLRTNANFDEEPEAIFWQDRLFIYAGFGACHLYTEVSSVVTIEGNVDGN